jgi:hypothetical protein
LNDKNLVFCCFRSQIYEITAMRLISNDAQGEFLLLLHTGIDNPSSLLAASDGDGIVPNVLFATGVTTVAVPEPTSFGIGAMLCGLMMKRSRKQNA